MSKRKCKKQSRRLALVRLRAEFLGIEGAANMGMKKASHLISKILGYHKFMTYIISSKKLTEWNAFKETQSAASQRVRKVLYSQTLSRSVDHGAEDIVHDLSLDNL